MQFFEIKNPYYSLIRAKNAMDAAKEYIYVVAGGDENFKEISNEIKRVKEENALKRVRKLFSGQVLDVIDEDLIQEQIKRILNSEHTEIILIDASLV